MAVNINEAVYTNIDKTHKKILLGEDVKKGDKLKFYKDSDDVSRAIKIDGDLAAPKRDWTITRLGNSKIFNTSQQNKTTSSVISLKEGYAIAIGWSSNGEFYARLVKEETDGEIKYYDEKFTKYSPSGIWEICALNESQFFILCKDTNVQGVGYILGSVDYINNDIKFSNYKNIDSLSQNCYSLCNFETNKVAIISDSRFITLDFNNATPTAKIYYFTSAVGGATEIAITYFDKQKFLIAERKNITGYPVAFQLIEVGTSMLNTLDIWNNQNYQYSNGESFAICRINNKQIVAGFYNTLYNITTNNNNLLVTIKKTSFQDIKKIIAVKDFIIVASTNQLFTAVCNSGSLEINSTLLNESDMQLYTGIAFIKNKLLLAGIDSRNWGILKAFNIIKGTIENTTSIEFPEYNVLKKYIDIPEYSYNCKLVKLTESRFIFCRTYGSNIISSVLEYDSVNKVLIKKGDYHSTIQINSSNLYSVIAVNETTFVVYSGYYSGSNTYIQGVVATVNENGTISYGAVQNFEYLYNNTSIEISAVLVDINRIVISYKSYNNYIMIGVHTINPQTRVISQYLNSTNIATYGSGSFLCRIEALDVNKAIIHYNSSDNKNMIRIVNITGSQSLNIGNPMNIGEVYPTNGSLLKKITTGRVFCAVYTKAQLIKIDAMDNITVDNVITLPQNIYYWADYTISKNDSIRCIGASSSQELYYYNCQLQNDNLIIQQSEKCYPSSKLSYNNIPNGINYQYKNFTFLQNNNQTVIITPGSYLSIEDIDNSGNKSTLTGSTAQFNTTNLTDKIKLDNNTIIWFWKDSSSKVFARIVKNNLDKGKTIELGIAQGAVRSFSAVALDGQRFVFSRIDNTGNIYTSVCNVNGTSIEKGTEYICNYPGASLSGIAVLKTETDKIVIAVITQTSTYKLGLVAASIAGSVISFGNIKISSELNAYASTDKQGYIDLYNTSANKFVVIYSGNQNHIYSSGICEYSGNEIFFRGNEGQIISYYNYFSGIKINNSQILLLAGNNDQNNAYYTIITENQDGTLSYKTNSFLFKGMFSNRSEIKAELLKENEAVFTVNLVASGEYSGWDPNNQYTVSILNIKINATGVKINDINYNSAKSGNFNYGHNVLSFGNEKYILLPDIDLKEIVPVKYNYGLEYNPALLNNDFDKVYFSPNMAVDKVSVGNLGENFIVAYNSTNGIYIVPFLKQKNYRYGSSLLLTGTASSTTLQTKTIDNERLLICSHSGTNMFYNTIKIENENILNLGQITITGAGTVGETIVHNANTAVTAFVSSDTTKYLKLASLHLSNTNFSSAGTGTTDAESIIGNSCYSLTKINDSQGYLGWVNNKNELKMALYTIDYSNNKNIAVLYPTSLNIQTTILAGWYKYFNIQAFSENKILLSTLISGTLFFRIVEFTGDSFKIVSSAMTSVATSTAPKIEIIKFKKGIYYLFISDGLKNIQKLIEIAEDSNKIKISDDILYPGLEFSTSNYGISTFKDSTAKEKILLGYYSDPAKYIHHKIIKIPEYYNFDGIAEENGLSGNKIKTALPGQSTKAFNDLLPGKKVYMDKISMELKYTAENGLLLGLARGTDEVLLSNTEEQLDFFNNKIL